MGQRIVKVVLGLALATQVASASYLNCLTTPCAMCLNFSSEDKAIATIQSKLVKGLISSAIDGDYFGHLGELESIYKEQLEESQKQNELLKQYLALLQKATLQEKQIAFLTNKFNHIQSMVNQIEVLEK